MSVLMTGPAPMKSFDDRLARMIAERPPGREYTQREIARFCGVSHTLLQYTENRAMKKMRKRLLTIQLAAECLPGA